MKKIVFVLMAIFCMSFAHAAFTTQVAGTIGSLSGVTELEGSSLTVTIQSTDGSTVYVTGSVSSGTYTSGMTILSSSVSLEYSTKYTYNLSHSTYGDFLFNFTTPAESGNSGVELHSGQTTSYGTGEDDADKDGTAKSYTDNGDGTVTDDHTGLVWQKSDNGATTLTWENALTYCSNLANGVDGLTDGSSAGDWRLPSFVEGATLIDFGAGGYKNAAFTWSGSYYWLGTTRSSYTGNAYYLLFDIGYIFYDGMTSDTHSRAKCVRDQ